MITGVAQCGTCIWDPTTGERLSTCRGCYEKELRPSHPVQLMVGAPLGPDMNGLLYTLREMYKAEDEGNEAAWHTSYTTLRAIIETIP